MPRSQAYRPIFWGGLIAGALDLTAAFVNSGVRGVGPLRVLRAIASGLLGADAAKGGFATATLGSVLHFLIATAATAVYYAASRKMNVLVQQAIFCGTIYGVAVYLFMNLIVLPLSAFPYKISYTLEAVVTGLIIHILFVGLPIALVVRWHSK
ncbi:MAG: hypothetical protein ACREOO_03870 [bacterium]